MPKNKNANNNNNKKSNNDDDGSEGASKVSAGKVKGSQSINVRHILCEKYSKKEEALAKLQAGEPFNKVAEQYSEDKARQGGSLGWKQRAGLLPAFQDCAFDPTFEVSSVASPKWREVKTSEGYHIVMLEGKK